PGRRENRRRGERRDRHRRSNDGLAAPAGLIHARLPDLESLDRLRGLPLRCLETRLRLAELRHLRLELVQLVDQLRQGLLLRRRPREAVSQRREDVPLPLRGRTWLDLLDCLMELAQILDALAAIDSECAADDVAEWTRELGSRCLTRRRREPAGQQLVPEHARGVDLHLRVVLVGSVRGEELWREV